MAKHDSLIFLCTNTCGTEHLTIYRKCFFFFTQKAHVQPLMSFRTHDACHYICLICYSQNFKKLNTLRGNFNVCFWGVAEVYFSATSHSSALLKTKSF